jgi:hypothetical protein
MRWKATVEQFAVHAILTPLLLSVVHVRRCPILPPGELQVCDVESVKMLESPFYLSWFLFVQVSLHFICIILKTGTLSL